MLEKENLEDAANAAVRIITRFLQKRAEKVLEEKDKEDDAVQLAEVAEVVEDEFDSFDEFVKELINPDSIEADEVVEAILEDLDDVSLSSIFN